MATNVLDATQFPYSAVVSIRATFADGRVSYGTGSLIGKNDVLTSTHLVYRPDFGGYATSLWVYPGADFNGSRLQMGDTPFGGYLAESIVAFPERVYADSNHATNSFNEIAHDIAIIGLSHPIGFQTGWFGLSYGVNEIQYAVAIGYPGEATGMVYGDVLAHSLNGLWISAYSADGSVLMGPGSSGGPLYVLDSYLPSIIGVKSSGTSEINYWTDIDNKFDNVKTAIDSNDNLIGGSLFVEGTFRNDHFFGETTNLVIDGLAGIDRVTYVNPSSQYVAFRTGNGLIAVTNAANDNTGDILKNIERVQFTDRTIAFDVAPSENAGSLYMLYKAAFNRDPDPTGMGYWLAQVDNGKDLVTDIAAGFVRAKEFTDKYGTGSNHAFYVDQLYLNVLDRVGELEGVTYWNTELNSGKRSKAEVLVQFATLPEGAGLVAEQIASGIAYQEWGV